MTIHPLQLYGEGQSSWAPGCEPRRERVESARIVVCGVWHVIVISFANCSMSRMRQSKDSAQVGSWSAAALCGLYA